MEIHPDKLKGCLLGLAIGDAMGLAVDTKALDEIFLDYGPAGLLGYDLTNGVAEISSHTQIAAFSCNGLLLSLARGQNTYLASVTLALKEWAHAQHLPGDPKKRSCWLAHVPQMRSRKCMDARTLDALTRDILGTPENPANQSASPGTLPAAVPVGLIFRPERMDFSELGKLGAQIVALTHGDPLAILSGAVVAYAIAGMVHAPDAALEENLSNAVQAMQTQYAATFLQAEQLGQALGQALTLGAQPQESHSAIMEQLRCSTCAEILAGAFYAISASGGDFDTAMIIAVNHSGKSAAVAALTGALLGAAQGESALPEFYLESLPSADIFRQLAADLYACCPGQLRNRLFDHDFDRRYIQGLPVDPNGWEEA